MAGQYQVAQTISKVFCKPTLGVVSLSLILGVTRVHEACKLPVGGLDGLRLNLVLAKVFFRSNIRRTPPSKSFWIPLYAQLSGSRPRTGFLECSVMTYSPNDSLVGIRSLWRSLSQTSSR